jgi:protein-S-isoprenylcysteine O-methyltransferase Ste14
LGLRAQSKYESARDNSLRGVAGLRFVVAGALSFAFFYLFDLNKTRKRKRWGGILFALGFSALALSTAGVLAAGRDRLLLPEGAKAAFYLLALLFGLITLYALFFALPFGRTYASAERGSVVDTGLYALCRHPGVIFFFLAYLCLAFAAGSDLMFWAMLAWTAMDVIHVWVQDKFFFPRTLEGYAAYQQSTPFLWPTKQSIGKCIKTLRKGGLPGESG